MFFRTKSEKAADKAVSRATEAKESAVEAGSQATDSIRAAAVSVLNSVSEAVAPKAEHASEVVKERTAKAREAAGERAAEAREEAADRTSHLRSAATDARDKAVSNLDKGIDNAVPKAQERIGAAGKSIDSAVDSARDTLVDDLLPRLQEMLGNVQSGKDDLLARTDGPVAAVTGAPKAKKKKGSALLTIGVLAAIGAAVTYAISQKKDEPEVDPWAGSTGETEAAVAAPEVDPAEVTTEPGEVEVTEIADAGADMPDLGNDENKA